MPTGFWSIEKPVGEKAEIVLVCLKLSSLGTESRSAPTCEDLRMVVGMEVSSIKQRVDRALVIAKQRIDGCFHVSLTPCIQLTKTYRN